MKKIQILFEELQKKYPDAIDDNFVTKITEAIQDIVDSEVEKGKTEITESEKDKIREELKEEMVNESKTDDETIEKLINTLDIFSENAMDEFVEEHSEKITESIKSNVAFDVVEKLTEVLGTHGIITESAIVDKDVYEEKLEKANKTISNLMGQISEAKTENTKLEAIGIVDEICEKYNYDQTLKFYALIEDYSIDDAEEFKTKVESLAEIFEAKIEKDEEDEDNEDEKGEKVDKDSMKDKDESDDKDESKEDEDSDDKDDFMAKVRSGLKNKKKDKEDK